MSSNHRPSLSRRSFSGRTLLTASALLAAAALPSTVRAQAWPGKPIRLVVPFVPGGSTDLLARRIGEKLSAALEQPVIVENRGGAGGTTGTDSVAKSPADGYTLLFGVTGTNAISATLYPKLPYDPVRDFAPITLVVSAPLVIVVNATSPLRDLGELAAFAKANPGKLTHGSPGNGTSMHLTGEMFALASGTRLVHVPYRGSAPAMQDLIGGQIDLMFGDLLVVSPMVSAGKLRALAVTSAQRHPMYPNVPTVAESGFAGFEALSWQGVFAPAGTPAPVVSRLSTELGRILTSPDLKEYFASRGFIVEARSPEATGRFVQDEVDKWGRIVKASGATAQ